MTHAPETGQPATENHLAGSKSPYLLQHADNPVDWYPWGPEAFARAQKEDKPIFLSIGYATCHWCHVMAHESFEDPRVAALMNETFVNIKVDREERPDIDQVYMTVCQMMTGSGGWPLTIIMTPDKQPFYAATYVPRESRYGRIGMLDLIPRIFSVWDADRAKVVGTTRQIAAALARQESRSAGGSLDPGAVDGAFRQLAARYDASNGGFGSAPKFPSPHNLVFLTRFWRATGNRLALDMVELTLEQMRRGGVYDQVGFGFHRYSTDAEWLVPHFEKMLYDQATLTMAYTEAWQATGNKLFERTVREILAYVQRDMTSPEGAFYSAEDADSEGEEGRFYLWTLDEMQRAVGPDDAALAVAAWSLAADGNFADEATGRRTGANIPHLSGSRADAAAAVGVEPRVFEARLETIREKLFSIREQRVHPLKDDKVLADWNGLMAAAMAGAGRAFGEPSWIAGAERATTFVLDRMRDGEGRLLHRYRDGDASIPAFLDDYVFMTTAMLELFEATFDARFLAAAIELQGKTDALFADGEHGGYYFSATDNEELLVRQKEVYDGAMPSGNSMAVDNLVRLARLTGASKYEESADRVIAAFASEVTSQPSGHSQLVSALQRRIAPSIEIVIVGDPEAADTRSLIDTARSSYLPNAALLVVPTGESGARVRELVPYVRSYETVDGKAAAYLCRGFQCQLPTTDAAKLAEMLEEASTPGFVER